MCENNKNYGGSEVKSSLLSPLLSQVSKGASKIFILTPEVLQSLGIAGRIGIKKATTEAVQNEDASKAGTKAPSEVDSQGYSAVASQMAKGRTGNASKKKRKRRGVTERTAEKKEENESSTGDLLELQQRLSATEGELSASEENVKEETSSAKTTKARQKVYAAKVANDPRAETNDESTTKDAKLETESATIIGLRTSRRRAKPKKFNDYVTTDDVNKILTKDVLDFPSAVPKHQSRKSYPGAKKAQAAQSGPSIDETGDLCEKKTSLEEKLELANTIEKRRPTSDTGEISSAHNSCSTVPETFDDIKTLRRSEIVRTYTRRNSKATKLGQSVIEKPTTEIESLKYENSETNMNSSSLPCLMSEASKIEPIKPSILKTYSSRKVKKKIIPVNIEQTDKPETKKIDESDVSKLKTTTRQTLVVSQQQSDFNQPEITNNCEKPKTNDPLRQSDKQKAETDPGELKTRTFISRTKIHCAQSFSSESYENSGAGQSSIDLPLENVEQSSGLKSKLNFEPETGEIRSSETDLSRTSEIHILKTPDKRVVSAKPTKCSDKQETNVPAKDSPISREGYGQSSTFKPEEDFSLRSDLPRLRDAKKKITKQAQPKPPSEMKCSPSVDVYSPDKHEVITSQTTTTSLDQSSASTLVTPRLGHNNKVPNPKPDTVESTNGNKPSTSKLDTLKSRDESEARASRLKTPRPADNNKIVVSSLETLSTLGKKEDIESKLGSPIFADTNDDATNVDSPKDIDKIDVDAAKLYTPSSGRGKKSQLAKIGTPRSRKKNKSKPLPDVPSSPAKNYHILKADDGLGCSQKNEGIDSKLRASGFADQSKTTTLELEAPTSPHGRDKRSCGWTNKREIEASSTDALMSPYENVVVAECDVPASSDINETIVLEQDISSALDRNELESRHNIPKSSPCEKESSGSKAQLSEENKVVDGKLNTPNSPNKKDTSKNDTSKFPDSKTYRVLRAQVSNESIVIEAKQDMPNSSNEKESSKRDIPKDFDKEKKTASKAHELLSNKNKAMEAKLDRWNTSMKKETSKRNISNSTEKEVIGVLSKTPVPISDKSKAIDTELEIPTSPYKNEAVVSDPAPLPQDKNACDSTGLDGSRSPDLKDEKELPYPHEDEVKKASWLSEVTTRIANPSTANSSSCNIATIVSTDISVVEIETETTEKSGTIIETPAVEDNPVELLQVSVTRKKGRPRKSQNTVNADASMTTGDTLMESVNLVDASTDSVEVTVENSCRMKKPVQRNENETDGKGLSDDDSDVAATREVIVPARRLGRPPGSVSSNKRRGRRRGQGRGRVDHEYVPRERASRDQKPELEKSDAVEEQSISEKPKAEFSSVSEVECGKCKKIMSKKSWPHHNLMTHNDMGWLSDQPEPDFKNDEKLLRTVLAAVVRKKKRKGCFTCETCGDEKRSAHGFISHLQVCGKTEDEREALLVTCPICGNKMMTSSVPMHERFHRQMKTTKELEKLMVTNIDLGKEKRKAAEKAATKITEFTDLIKEDEAPTKKRRLTNIELKNLIAKSRDTMNAPNRCRGLWKKELSEKGKATCRHPGCNFLGDTIESMFEHDSNCSCAPRVNYVCKICNFSHEAEEKVMKHVRSEHPSEQTKTREEDCDFEYKDNSSSSSEYESERLSDERPRKSGPTQQKSEISLIEKEQRPIIDVKFLSAEGPVYSKSYYLPAIRWTMEFESKNYCLRLFEKLSPKAMRLLSDDKARGYLPKLETSMRIKDTKGETDHGATGTRVKVSDWMTWQRFQGKISDGTPTLFAGGPVWAVAWLTIPAVMYAEEVDQYVAVSTHPTMESVYSVGKSHTGKNIIQIWNLGHLDNRNEDVPAAPRFAYGIAHDKGTIWCLEWCPSGCYEHSSFLDKQKTDEHSKSLRRMGLLAAACSDGCVHVFSLPFLNKDSSMSAEESSSNELPIYETRPLLTLLISTSMYEKSEQSWQCTKLNWSRELGHDTIIAGFSNGYIALWDLTSESPLFTTKRADTTLIEAFHHFHAHGHAVSFVQLIPYGNKRFFVSASYDRSTKVWDLEDTSCPLSTRKRGVATDGAWLTHWPGYLTAYDDATVQASSTYLMLLRQAAVKAIALLPAKSTTFTVGVSDYANSIAHGTLAGEVLVIFPQQLWHHREMEREIPMKRAVASTVEVVDFDTRKAGDKENKKIKSNAENNEGSDYRYMPETYEECRNRFGIVFRRSLRRPKGDAVQKRVRPMCSERLADVNIEQYPFTSVNRMSWNPNAWSYLWLCVGYQNGLVRFLHFNAAKLARESSRLLPTHAASMLDEAGMTSECENKVSF